MRRHQRLIAATVLIALSGALGGCASGGSFDPSDLLDFLDTKKKLPGDRKPVFPEGVPGLEQGVPKDLYKSEVEKQQLQEQQASQAAAAPAPVEEPKAKKGKKSKQAAAAAAPADQPPQDGEAAAVEEGAAGMPPAPKPKKIARRRTTAPPPDDAAAAPAQPQAAGASAFPAPMPSGTFSR